MRYYKVQAERIGRLDIGRAADDMQTELHVIMMASGRDPMFDHNAVWIVASEEQLGHELQEIVWRYNAGAWCAMTEIDEDFAESYC